MAEYPLISLKGRMTDRHFFSQNVCLAVSINATSFKLSGIAKDLAEIYPHANLFEGRNQLFNLNRTILSNRAIVGSLVVKESPSSTNYPHIVGLVTQFGPGDSVEYNPTAKYFVENSRDVHYVTGLIADTKENRREQFKSCLQHLGDYVMQNKAIKKVIFPSGIGRRGKLDQEWKINYLNDLRDLARRLDLHDIGVVLLELENPWNNNNNNNNNATHDIAGIRSSL